MARTVEQIYDQLGAEASNYPILGELEANSSNMSFWHYMKLVFAFGANQIEIIWDQFKEEILSALKVDNIVGTKGWLYDVIDEWQYGDELKLKYNKPYYETIDPSKQIIKRRSVNDLSGGGILIRVQELSGTEIVAMSSAKVSAFETYINRRKIASMLIQVQSNNANILTLNASVVLNKEVYKSNGQRHTDSKYGTLDALRDFVQKAEFDEVIYLSTLDDYMNDQPGIVAFHLTACTIDGTTASLTSGKITLPNGFGKVNESDSAFNARMTYELI